MNEARIGLVARAIRAESRAHGVAIQRLGALTDGAADRLARAALTALIDAPARARDAALASIAKREAHIETLKSRGRDALDFHTLGVGEIRRMLEEAYELGVADAVRADM